jgi:hypothetical protein
MIEIAVIVSVHIAQPGVLASLRLLRAASRPIETPGLRYAEAAGMVPLAGKGPPIPPRGVWMLASWDDDDALDRFLADHPIAQRFADGWHVRMEPKRIWGAWPEMSGLPAEEEPMDPDEPATVLTLGRPKLPRLLTFARTSRPAEKLAVRHPAFVAGTAGARLPRFVATFSLWRTVSEMRDYALGRPDPGHLNAIKADRKNSFHHQEAFVRFRPYASHGRWNGRDPLSEVASRSASRA